jgi:hypothetical protein
MQESQGLPGSGPRRPWTVPIKMMDGSIIVMGVIHFSTESPFLDVIERNAKMTGT